MKNRTVYVDKRNGASLFGLGLVAGALGGFVIGQRLAVPRRMPNLIAWQRVMAEKRGEVEAAMLAARAQTCYDEFYAHRPRFANLALRTHLESRILPGLALYQTLCEENDDQDAALAEMEALFKATFGRPPKLMSLLGFLPNPLAFFRRMMPWNLRFAFPSQGWKMEVAENSDRCFGFNVHRCFYLDMLTTYGVPELTALYCKTDDWLFEGLPLAMTWERTRTLGRGDDVCDFRWCQSM